MKSGFKAIDKSDGAVGEETQEHAHWKGPRTWKGCDWVVEETQNWN